MQFLKVVALVLFVAAVVAAGIKMHVDCMQEHSFMNCSSSKGWGYATWFD